MFFLTAHKCYLIEKHLYDTFAYNYILLIYFCFAYLIKICRKLKQLRKSYFHTRSRFIKNYNMSIGSFSFNNFSPKYASTCWQYLTFDGKLVFHTNCCLRLIVIGHLVGGDKCVYNKPSTKH